VLFPALVRHLLIRNAAPPRFFFNAKVVDKNQ
jgi:hypothetical protein